MSTAGRPIDEYSGYIVDMDGTLYRQKPVRWSMLFRLLSYFLLHPLQIKELYAILIYRRIRERNAFADEADFEEKQIEYVSKHCRIEKDRFKAAQDRWMNKVPLECISRNRDEGLIGFLKSRISEKATVIVYSDYPVKDKLKAVGLKPDLCFYSGDPEIACMKPDPKGLKNIIRISGIPAEDILYIGDRYEKDGKCAESCHMDYLILKHKFNHKAQSRGKMA